MFGSKIDTEMLIGDFDVYIDDDTMPSMYTKSEKPLLFSPEFADFFEGIPQILIRTDLIKFGIAMSFTAMQWTAKIVELMRGGKLETGSVWNTVHFGTDYVPPTDHKYRFVRTKVDGKAIEICIYKGAVREMPDIETGGTEHYGIPGLVQARKDPNQSNSEKNLGYIRFEQ